MSGVQRHAKGACEMSESREQFEGWYTREYYQGDKEASAPWLEREGEGYLREHPAKQWQAWQASRASICVELPDEQPGYMYYAPDAIEAITKTGVRVK